MENHGGHGNRENYGPRNRDSHGYGNRDLGMMGGPAPYDPHPRTARRPSMALLLFGLVLWSLLAWVGYALVDPALGWAAASSGALVDGGKGLATAVGAGKEVGAVVDKLNVSGAVGQTIAFLRVGPEAGDHRRLGDRSARPPRRTDDPAVGRQPARRAAPLTRERIVSRPRPSSPGRNGTP